jgi:hypothetical protein
MHAVVSFVGAAVALALFAGLLLLVAGLLAALVMPADEGQGDDPTTYGPESDFFDQPHHAPAKPWVEMPLPELCSGEGAHRWEARWVEGEGVAYYTCLDCGKTVESFQ